jgi:hypothetical protein
MDIQVMVTIPKYVFLQAHRVAEREQRSVDEVLNEALVVAFPTVHIHPQRAQMEAEIAAFERQKPQLLAQYQGRYVAMRAGKVVDDDSDKVELAMRIDELFPEDVVLIKLVTAEPDQELVMRSPRLIR